MERVDRVQPSGRDLCEQLVHRGKLHAGPDESIACGAAAKPGSGGEREHEAAECNGSAPDQTTANDVSEPGA